MNFSWSSFKEILLNTMSNCVPNKLITVRRSLPWLNKELMSLFRKRDRAHHYAKQTNLPQNWSTFRKLRNKATSALRSAKRDFFKDLSSKLHNPKQFWSAYHAVCSNHQRIPHLLTNGSTTTESDSAIRPICSIPILPLVSPSLIHHQILSIQVQSHQPPLVLYLLL